MSFVGNKMNKAAWAAILCCCCLFVGEGLGAKLPKTWKVCKNDASVNDCLKGAIQGALGDLVKGIQPLGVLPIDPLRFNSLLIDQGTGPVAIKLDFIDIDLVGIKDLKVETVNTDWKTMNITATSPKITVKGKYKINGKVLILPIQGEGDCVLDLINFIGDIRIKFSEKKSGDKVHFHIDHLDFLLDVNPLKSQFDNLFNGDKALGDNMNKFLNENWEEILRELRPAISQSFGEGFREIGNRVFSKLTKNQLTPA